MSYPTAPSTVSISTLDLLDGLAREEGDAWERFDARYRPLLLGVLVRAGLAQNEAEDFAQEALLGFVKAHRGGKVFHAGGGVRNWLITAARSRMIDQFRRLGPSVVRDSVISTMPEDVDLESAWDEERDARIFDEAVDRLRRSSGLRQSSIRVFELTVLEGRSAQEAADELHMKPGAVYVAKHRSVRQLRSLVQELEAAYGENAGSPT